MEAIAMRANSAPTTWRSQAMIPTPRSDLESQRIAESTRTPGHLLLMGTSDLAKELDSAHTHARLPFITSLGLAACSRRACLRQGLRSSLKASLLDLNDGSRFRGCLHRQGSGTRFRPQRKTLAPKQVGAAGRSSTPNVADVEWSRKIIKEAHSAASARGEGVVEWSTTS
ncbi:MAG: hypothetical protein IPK39_24105 [Sulfuritalea sp.]|nr:hypothetical protein [Sulfuritalea sp.]